MENNLFAFVFSLKKTLHQIINIKALNEQINNKANKSFHFYRTSTMIDIITTRFREAYTWVVPTERERLQSRPFKKERNSSMKKLSDELQKNENYVNISFLISFVICVLLSINGPNLFFTHLDERCQSGDSEELCKFSFTIAWADLSGLFKKFGPGSLIS